MVDGAVIGGGVALAEEVGFDGAVGGAEPLPVDLVEVVRFEDEGADDASAGGGLQEDVDLAEHNVFVAADRGGVSGSLDIELGSAGSIGEGGAISYLPIVGSALCEVGEDGVAFAISLVGRASCMMLAVYLLEVRVRVSVLFAVGLQSVNVWPLTKLRLEKSTAVAARVESILFVCFEMFVVGVLRLKLKLRLPKGGSESCKSEDKTSAERVWLGKEGAEHSAQYREVKLDVFRRRLKDGEVGEGTRQIKQIWAHSSAQPFGTATVSGLQAVKRVLYGSMRNDAWLAVTRRALTRRLQHACARVGTRHAPLSRSQESGSQDWPVATIDAGTRAQPVAAFTPRAKGQGSAASVCSGLLL